MDNNILVVAFDGLDYELIQKYNCRTFLEMQEFGQMDNHTRMHSIKTSELYASFITGNLPEKTEVTGVNKWSNPWIDKFESWADNHFFFRKFAGLRRAIWESINRLGAKHIWYRKKDIKTDTLFEEVSGSKPLFVPSYNPSWIYRANKQAMLLKYDAPIEDLEGYIERDYLYRIQTLSKELKTETRPFLMCHFHKPDMWQHFYANDGINNESKIREVYAEMDELAAQILKLAEDKYDWILFISDHGLPTENAHNKNAFYASSRKLPDNEPHITDFYDWISEYATVEPLSEIDW